MVEIGDRLREERLHSGPAQVSEKQRTRKPGAKGNNLQSQEKGPEERDQS